MAITGNGQPNGGYLNLWFHIPLLEVGLQIKSVDINQIRALCHEPTEELVNMVQTTQ